MTGHKGGFSSQLWAAGSHRRFWNQSEETMGIEMGEEGGVELGPLDKNLHSRYLRGVPRVVGDTAGSGTHTYASQPSGKTGSELRRTQAQ
jgi:hypothetical protein